MSTSALGATWLHRTWWDEQLERGMTETEGLSRQLMHNSEHLWSFYYRSIKVVKKIYIFFVVELRNRHISGFLRNNGENHILSWNSHRICQAISKRFLKLALIWSLLFFLTWSTFIFMNPLFRDKRSFLICFSSPLTPWAVESSFNLVSCQIER